MPYTKHEGQTTKTRPNIPAEIQRLVAIESGHRCAVCGESCSLERAHIIPWCKTRDHSVENLLLLCANCHHRADNEGWGEKTLRIYKENPWILRKNENQPSYHAVTVRLELDLKPEDVTEAKQQLLKLALSALLDVEVSSVRIKAIDTGSLIITFELPEEAATELLAQLASYYDDVRITLGSCFDDPATESPTEVAESSEVDPGSDSRLNASLDELNLSVHAHKCMSRLGIRTVRDLIHRTSDELLETRNFGITSLTEIRNRLSELGLALKDD